VDPPDSGPVAEAGVQALDRCVPLLVAGVEFGVAVGERPVDFCRLQGTRDAASGQALLTAVMAWPAAVGAVSDSFAKPTTSSSADRYLEFVAGRCRPNTLRAVAFDLKAFFEVTGKDPVGVTAADGFEFLAHQRGDRAVVRLADAPWGGTS
jgi:hypothetical protein